MIPSDFLFNLIKSLTKSEKRYFKLYISGFGNRTNYVKLFDAIQSLGEKYDEGKIKSENQNAPFIKNLPFYKNYLYYTILKNLLLFHQNRTVEMKILLRLQQAEVLIEKKLFKQSIKEIQFAKRTALNYEVFGILIYIIEYELRIIHLLAAQKGAGAKIHKLMNEKNKYLQILINANEYMMLNSKIYDFITDHAAGEKDHKKIVKQFLKHKLLKNEKNALSTNAKLIMYHSLVLCNYSLQKTEKCYLNEKKVINVYESKKLDKMSDVYNYLLSLQNYLYLCLTLKKFDEYKNVYDKLDSLMNGNKINKVELGKVYYFILIRSYNINLNYYINTQQFHEGAEFIKTIKNFLEKEALSMNREEYRDILLNAAEIFFSGFDYVNAMYWNNKIILDKNIQLPTELYIRAMIINLLIHYEHGNYELLYSLFASLEKYMKQIKGDKFEKNIINYLKSLLLSKDKESFNIILKEIKFRFKEMERSRQTEKPAGEYYFFKKWIKYKLKVV